VIPCRGCAGRPHRTRARKAGKQSAPQWLAPDAAVAHSRRGIGIWDWACNDAGTGPEVVLACCGDVPTVEMLAAVTLLRRHIAREAADLVLLDDHFATIVTASGWPTRSTRATARQAPA
jgi:xylulose-5-phosphate/fructose-6-phosphate phosphoketolase